jgi:hypothetical protein
MNHDSTRIAMPIIWGEPLNIPLPLRVMLSTMVSDSQLDPMSTVTQAWANISSDKRIHSGYTHLGTLGRYLMEIFTDVAEPGGIMRTPAPVNT